MISVLTRGRTTWLLAAMLLASPGASWAAKRSVEHAIEQLQHGDPAGALSTLEKLLNRVGPKLVPGRESGKSLGPPLLYRAVAEFELGKLDDSRWSWHMALIFDPEVAASNLRGLGAAGQFLLAQPILEPDPETVVRFERSPLDIDFPEGVKPPVRKHAPMPRFSEALQRMRIEGDISVLVRVNEHGRLESPRLFTKAPRSGFWYSTLEALREWTFEPAVREGSPIPVWYALTVSRRIQ